MSDGIAAEGSEVFALTDEQIVGLGPAENVTRDSRSVIRADQGANGIRGDQRSAISDRESRAAEAGGIKPPLHSEARSAQGTTDKREIPRSADSARNDGKGAQAGRVLPQAATAEERPASEGGPYSSELGTVPEWLAERMKDPRDGQAARELWNRVQETQREATAYREVFATPEDARALKEIYPGGVSEANTAAVRARELDEIDAAFYRGDAAARMQLAQRMMAQDAAAFREMVEAGVRLLGQVTSGQRPSTSGAEVASGERGVASEKAGVHTEGTEAEHRGHGEIGEGSLRSGLPTPQASGRDDSGRLAESAQPRMAVPQGTRPEERPTSGSVPYNRGAESTSQSAGIKALHLSGQASATPEVVRAYEEFERSANAELEKSVGGAIARAMEQALPNLRTVKGTGQALHPSGQTGAQGAAPLHDRLANAVREEVEAGLKSDRELGEQVAKLMAGQRFDAQARAQVVRLIDARAQQLIPGAVKRVVSAWTQTTLAARGNGKSAQAQTEITQQPVPRLPLQKNAPHARNAREEIVRSLEEVPVRRGPRLDYRRVSDEDIVGL